MTEIIMRLRKCAEELSRIADAMTKQMSGTPTIDFEYDRPDPELVTYAETTVPEITRLDMLRCRPQVPVVIGKNVESHTVSFDLATMPHILVGGASGCGKTMFIHDLINGLVSSRSPEEVRLILFDPKCVEFVAYANLPHLVMPVLNENSQMASALNWAVVEVEKRLKMFTHVRVRNIRDYNNRKINVEERFGDIPETLPYIVIIVDELSDLMLQRRAGVVPAISRLSAKARAAGIHLVIATQCSGDNVVTGSIKANIPGRIAFKTATPFDSRAMLDDSGAECLIGRGDCLYRDGEGFLQRVQVPFISDDEIAVNVERAIAKYSATGHDPKLPAIVRCSSDVFEMDDDYSDYDSLENGGRCG